MKRRISLLALALAVAAIGVPAAHAAVQSPYKYLGHPASQDGVERVSATAVQSPYKYLGHPTSQEGVGLVATAVTGRPIDPASSPQVAGSTGFQWADAGIGAGFTVGIVVLAGAGAGLLISRQNRRQQSAHA